MFDPRDDARDRGEDGRERAYEGREQSGDPRDVFLHDVDLPLDREREYVLDRDQVYELDGDDSRTLATFVTAPLWCRPDYPLGPFARCVRLAHLKCRPANAWPEPDLRYFSNATARRSSRNSTMRSMIHGRPEAVCEHRPALCASSRADMSEVRPV
jgi:hypothetical protein